MENKPTTKKEAFKSESSIFAHPQEMPKKEQFVLPTWGIIVILFICFFALKSFIYITDEKRHGK